MDGFRKRTTPDPLRCDHIAQGFADDPFDRLIPARDLDYFDPTALQAGAVEVSRLPRGYMNRLERGG